MPHSKLFRFFRYHVVWSGRTGGVGDCVVVDMAARHLNAYSRDCRDAWPRACSGAQRRPGCRHFDWINGAATDRRVRGDIDEVVGSRQSLHLYLRVAAKQAWVAVPISLAILFCDILRRRSVPGRQLIACDVHRLHASVLLLLLLGIKGPRIATVIGIPGSPSIDHKSQYDFSFTCLASPFAQTTSRGKTTCSKGD